MRHHGFNCLWARSAKATGARQNSTQCDTFHRFCRRRGTGVFRERERRSQTIFANDLNVAPDLVSKWERSEKKPSGPALKLLTFVEKRGSSAVA